MANGSQNNMTACGPQKKKSLYYVHVAIGLAIIAIFWLLPPVSPITPLGMRCVGFFYRWFTYGLQLIPCGQVL